MNCGHCGRPGAPGDKFCAYCGKPLAPERKHCTQCGAEIRPESRFCAQCGHPQAPAASPGQSQSSPPPARAEASPVAAPTPKPTFVPPAKLPPLKKIKEMYLQGAKEQARDLLQEYVKGKANDAEAWNVLGNCYRDLDQDVLAEQAYRTALQLKPKTVGAYIGLGVLARRKEEYGTALDYYLEALKLDATSAAAWSSAAVVALKLSDDARAVEFAERAWSLDKSDAKLAANLAVAYHCVGRMKDRDRMYEQARRQRYGSMETLDQIFRGELSVRA
jgi:hypothetical protein